MLNVDDPHVSHAELRIMRSLYDLAEFPDKWVKEWTIVAPWYVKTSFPMLYRIMKEKGLIEVRVTNHDIVKLKDGSDPFAVPRREVRLTSRGLSIAMKSGALK